MLIYQVYKQEVIYYAIYFRCQFVCIIFTLKWVVCASYNKTLTKFIASAWVWNSAKLLRSKPTGSFCLDARKFRQDGRQNTSCELALKIVF